MYKKTFILLYTMLIFLYCFCDHNDAQSVSNVHLRTIFKVNLVDMFEACIISWNKRIELLEFEFCSNLCWKSLLPFTETRLSRCHLHVKLYFIKKITIFQFVFLAKLVPVGYGIKKLQVMCVVEDDKVSIDELCEQIAEFEDFVQSVDIAAMSKI